MDTYDARTGGALNERSQLDWVEEGEGGVGASWLLLWLRLMAGASHVESHMYIIWSHAANQK